MIELYGTKPIHLRFLTALNKLKQRKKWVVSHSYDLYLRRDIRKFNDN